MNWLPPGKAAAVCMSVDDVHPTAPGAGASARVGEAARAALNHLEWLIQRHPLLRLTLFTTPDWRSKAAAPTRNWRRRLPIVRHAFHASDVLARGALRRDRHLDFTAWLRDLRQVDFGVGCARRLRTAAATASGGRR